MKVIILCFGGRRGNIELQLPFIRRILAEHENVHYHLWDLARNDADHDYLQTISGERITVFDRYRGDFWWLEVPNIYRYYTEPQFEDAIFIKLDDDIVFIETESFGGFIRAIQDTPGAFVSAQTVNNGASLPTLPGLRDLQLPVPLRDIHLSVDFADLAHNYMFEHWRDLVDRPMKVTPTIDWLSINLVGYTYETGVKFCSMLGCKTPDPPFADLTNVPDCSWEPVLGDEGVANLLPHAICEGFVTAHLTFGPQIALMSEQHVAGLQKDYHRIGQEYLRSTIPAFLIEAKEFEVHSELQEWAISQAPPGVAVEFGVGEGWSLRRWAKYRFTYGFDSFEGLPEDWRAGWPKGTFAQDYQPVVENAEIIVGLFEDTVPKFVAEHDRNVAFVHVDCDIFSSTVSALKVAPLLAPGAILLFDELINYPTWRDHEYRALIESNLKFEAMAWCAQSVAVRVC